MGRRSSTWAPPTGRRADPEEAARLAVEREAAGRCFGIDDAYLELVAEPEVYADAVGDLVTGTDALARRLATDDFARIPYSLDFRCDGCLNSEFCLKDSAERDDLSLIPHLTGGDRSALRRCGIETTRDLALLKELRQAGQRGRPDWWPHRGRKSSAAALPRPGRWGPGWTS